MDFTVYLVEDDENLNTLLATYLRNEGWQVRSFLRGGTAKQAIPEAPHLWILDIMLPDLDGYQLIEEIKQFSPETPVIFISARDADLDRITGLEKGSDDYLAKPFSPRELVIRSRKLLQRVYGGQQGDSGEIVKYGNYRVDPFKRSVYTAQQEKAGLPELTSLEFDLLVYLLHNKHLALSREQVLSAVWGSDYLGRDRVVDDTIRRLRKKLPDLKIETLYGYGYRLVEQ